VDLGKVEPVRVRGDAARLRQLFLNLVENAVKYTPPRGRVTLSVEHANGGASVSVKDTGIGIPRRDQTKIFDRFYRVKQESLGNIGGSGLGLAIAKWIAEAHRGTIDVKSEPRKGSTFTVVLPKS
jgi:signal transduction histidine kinase